MNDRNLVILLTGPGVAALSTIRLIGPAVRTFLSHHFSRSVEPGMIVHGELRDLAGVIDDPVVALASDASFVDITLHGGVWVAQAAIECAEREGFQRLATHEAPTEAFIESGDLFDAEVQAALPQARTELAARTLLAQRGAWEAWIHSATDREPIDTVLADRSLEHLLNTPSVAIVGLPNAGKSTLANQLFGTDRSIVSPIAGTTRDWVGEDANLGGLIVRLLDTPGRHDTWDMIERKAIDYSDAPIADASLLIVLLDASRPFASQSHLLALGKRQLLAVANKMDVAMPDWNADFLAARSILPIVAKESSAVRHLVRAIHSAFDVGHRPPESPRCWTRRQRDAARLCHSDSELVATLFAAR